MLYIWEIRRTCIADSLIKSLLLPIKVIGRSNVIEHTAVAFHGFSHFEHLCAVPNSAHPATTYQQLCALRGKLTKGTQWVLKAASSASVFHKGGVLNLALIF
jgi:hypothetical protein